MNNPVIFGGYAQYGSWIASHLGQLFGLCCSSAAWRRSGSRQPIARRPAASLVGGP